MTKHQVLALLGTLAIGGSASVASAQVEKRDHREGKVDKRDHRDDEAKRRDHRDKRDQKKRRPPRDEVDKSDKPEVETRDHRGGDGGKVKVEVRDHRGGAKVKVETRDHRGGAEVEVRDHRGGEAEKVEVRDHRGEGRPDVRAPAEKVMVRRPRPIALPRVPVVSSFRPHVGGADTKVIVRGRRFDDQLQVTVGGVEAAAVNVTPRIVTFRVPPGAADGRIVMKHPSARRGIFVGTIDLEAKAPEIDRDRRDAERRERAQKRWDERRAKLAKDRAERAKALEERRQELRETRDQRRKERRAKLRAKWEAKLLADAQIQAELALHAERAARLARMLRLAEVGDHGKLAVRIEILIDKEDARHDRRMELLQTSFTAEAGAAADIQ